MADAANLSLPVQSAHYLICILWLFFKDLKKIVFD